MTMRYNVEKELENPLPAGTPKQAALNALHKEQCLEQQRDWLINGNADKSKGVLMQKNTAPAPWLALHRGLFSVLRGPSTFFRPQEAKMLALAFLGHGK
jgi:hypothetical protein